MTTSTPEHETTAEQRVAPEDDTSTRAREWAAWRTDRERELRTPHGWLSLTAYHWLPERPSRLDGVPGLWSADGHVARVTVDAADELRIDGKTATGTYELSVPEAGSHQWASSGDTRVEVILRGGRYAIRLRDPQAPTRTGFTGVPAFPFSDDWIVDATFTPYPEPREVTVGAAREGLSHHLTAVGDVTFTLGGEPQSLVAIGAGDRLTLLFHDPTNRPGGAGGSSGRVGDSGAGGSGRLGDGGADGGADAGGGPADVSDVDRAADAATAPWRLLSVTRPDGDRLSLDFNRAVNLPFAFTDHGTCPRPPEQNVLTVAVLAGEKAPR